MGMSDPQLDRLPSSHSYTMSRPSSGGEGEKLIDPERKVNLSRVTTSQVGTDDENASSRKEKHFFRESAEQKSPVPATKGVSFFQLFR